MEEQQLSTKSFDLQCLIISQFNQSLSTTIRSIRDLSNIKKLISNVLSCKSRYNNIVAFDLKINCGIQFLITLYLTSRVQIYLAIETQCINSVVHFELIIGCVLLTSQIMFCRTQLYQKDNYKTEKYTKDLQVKTMKVTTACNGRV